MENVIGDFFTQELFLLSATHWSFQVSYSSALEGMLHKLRDDNKEKCTARVWGT